MKYDPYKLIPAVMVAVISDNKILLLERKNTGYRDGWYAMPGGHLEPNESLVEGASRELREETGLITATEDLELIHIYHNDQDDTGRAYVGFIFRAVKWSGEPRAKDGKVGAVKFFDINNLPSKTIPYLIPAIQQINSTAINITYSKWGGGNNL